MVGARTRPFGRAPDLMYLHRLVRFFGEDVDERRVGQDIGLVRGQVPGSDFMDFPARLVVAHRWFRLAMIKRV